jgi:hypothetical protein
MTATNHALTGAIIGLSITNPFLAVPLSVASHFAQDAIPHFSVDPKRDVVSSWLPKLLVVDLSLCVALAVLLIVLRPPHWQLACICGFGATSPDLMWVKKFIHARQTGEIVHSTALIPRFHSRIQWFTKPIGIAVEIVWAIGASLVLAALIHLKRT